MSLTHPLVLANRYEVGDLIGRGGMAEVHAGVDVHLGREVAVKILRSELARDGSFLLRFRREAQSAGALNHPAIVAIFDSGEQITIESGGAELPVPFIVMERVTGRTLRDVLHEDGPLRPRQAARIMADTLRALGYSHEKGIIHRDVKPANVMVSGGGDVKVMDFGIARAIADTAATMTNTAVVIGTAQYLSPEQAQGQDVDARSDIYSAGCLLFELLTGRTPFVGDSPVAVAYQHVGQEPEPPSHYEPSVPPELDAVVLRSLAKDPAERYQTAVDFATDLEAVLLGDPISDPTRALMVAAQAKAAEASGDAAQGSGGPAAGTAPRLVADLDGRRPRSQDPDTGTLPLIPPSQYQLRTRRRRLIATTVLVLLIAAITTGVLLATRVIGGPRDIDVPDVIRLTAVAATAELSQRGLTADVQREPSDQAVGVVIGQDPAPGSARAPGSAIVLRVSSGPRTLLLPDLKNYDQASARQRINDLHLIVGQIRQVDSFEVSVGNIVATEPKAGTQVQEGQWIDLLLSNGRVKVPSVVGMQQSAAQTALNKLGLQTRPSYVDSTRAIGTVVGQTYTDEKVAVGTLITLRVSKGRPTPPPTTTVTMTVTPSVPAAPSTSDSP